MIVPSGTVWAFSLLIVLMVKVLAYFLLVFIVAYIVGLGLIAFIKPIVKFINHE